VRLRRKCGWISSKVPVSIILPSVLWSLTFLLYLGLGDEGKRVLEEFSGTPPTEHTDVTDSNLNVENEQLWETLGQEGVAQGFIDDIQGLLDGK
jgi:hypothetical protein